jgi:ribonuclease HI
VTDSDADHDPDTDPDTTDPDTTDPDTTDLDTDPDPDSVPFPALEGVPALVAQSHERLGTTALKAKLFTDGGARGNPGPAAYAFVLEAEDGTVLDARGEAIGVATNNVAEYRALVAGLERAAEVGVRELEVVSDSELVVKQMRGEYKVKNRALQDLFLQASRLARGIHRVTYTAVRREHNELADSLVNEALDRAAG